MIAWIGAAGIGIANGVLREATFGKRLDERTANQLSASTAIAAFAGYFWRLHRRWPISGRADALRIGGVWLILTVAFEFTFGRLVAKKSWRELASEYNLAEGRAWPFVLAWIAIGPAVMKQVSARSART
jgi:membrane associated rhomboid family serine protease